MKRQALLTGAGNNHILLWMSTNSAHESGWQISEVVFGMPLLVAIAIQLVVPLGLSGRPLRPFVAAGGIICFMIGVFLAMTARRKFAQHGQYTDPGHPTTSLITTGVFSFSRNPLYLGVVFLVIGIGLIINSLWILIFLLASLVACHIILIAPEEKYLGLKFGEDYRTYTAQVHRWFGRKRRPG